MRVRKLSLREVKENAHTPLLALHLEGRMPKFYSRSIWTSVQLSCSVMFDSLQPQGLQEEMATHSSILAWEILWTEEPGRLPSMGSQKSQTQLSD